MPAQRLPWFKFWIGATSNGKVRVLDDATFRTWAELLDAAAQQPNRGRFASRAEAQAIVRRPAKHIAALIKGRLIDETPECLTMHDWDWWQRWRPGDANDSATSPEELTNDSLIDSRTTREHQRNGQSLRVGASARVREEERSKKKDVDVDVDKDRLASPVPGRLRRTREDLPEVDLSKHEQLLARERASRAGPGAA